MTHHYRSDCQELGYDGVGTGRCKNCPVAEGRDACSHHCVQNICCGQSALGCGTRVYPQSAAARAESPTYSRLWSCLPSQLFPSPSLTSKSDPKHTNRYSASLYINKKKHLATNWSVNFSGDRKITFFLL